MADPNFASIGDRLVSSGENQKAAGERLTLFSVELKRCSEVFNEEGTLANAIVATETGLRETRNFLSPVSSAFSFVAEIFDSIKIPKITFKKKTVRILGIKLRFIKSISIGSKRPFRSIAERLFLMSEEINNIRQSIRTIANAMNEVRGQFSTIKEKLSNGSVESNIAGKMLITSGTQMIDAGNTIRN
jgi:hypothetical protein